MTERASVEYINSKRVPVIGSETGGNYFYESPMYFPQATHGTTMIEATLRGIADQTVPFGKKKLGILSCVEAEQCRDADQTWSKWGPRLGFDVVYRGTSSIAQPDFTAECLSARRAGAEVLIFALEANSVRRVVAACARQSYRPVFAVSALIIEEGMKDEPNLDGLVGTSGVFPWFQTGTPAVDEYRSALSKFGGIKPSGAASLGWVSGKVLETAGRNMPEPPTSAAILQGLWSMKDDTLGGLTQPLTFTENRPATPRACRFDVQIKNKAWVSPDGYKLHCSGDA